MQSSDIVAAFDFDGTVSRSDSLRDFIFYAVGGRKFAVGVICALPWFAGTLVGICDRADVKVRFLAATIKGLALCELEAVAQQYAVRKLPRLIRPEMAARIGKHKDLGHRLVLVSASPSVYLKHWASDVGFDAVLATELEFLDGRFSGHLASPNCWGAQKVRRLQQWFNGDRPQELFAYGDSRGDREMLAFSDHAWLRGRDKMWPLS